MTKEQLANAIKADQSIKYLIELEGDRLVIEIGVNQIMEHETLKAIRGKAPESIGILSTSMANTGNTSVYTPCLYAEVQAGTVVYYVADGHQRVQAAKDNGMAHIVCQVITRWLNVDAAFRECVNIQAARFEMTDQDVFSILRKGVMTVAEVSKQTGRKDTTLQKMKNVCEHKLLTDLIDKGVISTNVASGIIVKCNKNSEKINAFLNSLSDMYEKNDREAKHWKDKLGPNYKGKDKERMDIKHYFKGVDWKAWESAADKDGKTKITQGRVTFDFSEDGEPTSQEKLIIGDTASSWEKEIPIVMTTREHDKLPLDNLESFVQALPLIKQNLEIIIARRRKLAVAKEMPMASGNPMIETEAPPAPKKQKPDMKVT